MLNEDKREQAVAFMYDFLNNYLRLDDTNHMMLREYEKELIVREKKTELMHNDPMFRKAVDLLTDLLINQR